jgi:putative membrane-bound dehydrogenase-like protein
MARRVLSTVSAAALVLRVAAIARPQGYAPDLAAGKMTAPPGFTVSLVAAEPTVRQPVAIDFDERGRLWVMQYLQYPNPAGLTRVKVDRYSRTIYDRVPEPPPHGPRGADRLTILDLDPVHPGRPAARDFLTGLNLGSAFAFGHGGVFVLQVPYLLFYPDRDRDGVPDGDPEVLLSGFGMEDAHSVANSLTWGHDGWLYGCQGSTVTANIRGIEFQQGVWRYHPLTRKFELFCEGGGNSWGLDFDHHGNLLYSTNVGGFTMLHGVQGAYYWKSFGKHGALHHPYAYGYFDHVPHQNFTGGHVTVGGIVYCGDNFPSRFRDRYIAADLLGHAVYWHKLEADGSSFRSRHGGDLLRANDTWFAPSDVCLGPDGCVYVADWHDARTAHPDPDAEWDRSNGRVFRIAYGSPPPAVRFDLARRDSRELIKLLNHPNDWYSRTARRLLAERRDPHVIAPLRVLVQDSADDDLALQAMWALYVSGGFDEPFARMLLNHRNPDVRRWTVRLLGDECRVEPETARRLARLAADEPSPVVRSQLACTARRLSAADDLPIIRAIVTRDLDATDPHIPLLLWWAVERHAIAARDSVVACFTSPEVTRSVVARDVIVPRLIRRYAAAGTPDADAACVALLAPGAGDQLLLALEDGLCERPANDSEVRVAPELAAFLSNLPGNRPSTALLRVLCRLHDAAALRQLTDQCLQSKLPVVDRVKLLSLLGEVGPANAATPVLSLIGGKEAPAVQLAALSAWQRLGSDDQAARLIAIYSRLRPEVKARARAVLLSKRSWATALLRDVDAGRIPAAEFPIDELRGVASLQSPELDALVRKHWGNVAPATPEAKLADVRRLNNDLRAGPGDAIAGRALFTKQCGTCHRLFGEGGAVGPDLTHANRADRNYLLVSIVDPSSVIRREFVSYRLETKDGRVITGLIAEQSPSRVTLLDAKGERTDVPRGEMVSLDESPVSLMPDNLLQGLKPQELRDLFAYLQATSPPPPARPKP